MRVAHPPSTMWGLTMWVALVAVAWLFLQPRLHEDRPLVSSMLRAILTSPVAAKIRMSPAVGVAVQKLVTGPLPRGAARYR